MKRIEVERWAFRILEAIESGSYSEDSLVELKSNWPEAREIARQLGAHANSARMQPILWLFGVDEKQGIVDCEFRNVAPWRDQLNKEFDGHAPNFDHYNLQWDSQPFAVLVFSTDAPPYVVLNPKRGEPGSGPIDREVPWREGGTRSAKRQELLLIGVPSATEISLEGVGGLVRVTDNSTSSFHGWEVICCFYASSQEGRKIYIPGHTLQAWLITSQGKRIDLTNLAVNPLRGSDPHVRPGEGQLTIDGAGYFNFDGSATTDNLDQDIAAPISLEIRLRVAGAQLVSVIQQTLHRIEKTNQYLAWWEIS